MFEVLGKLHHYQSKNQLNMFTKNKIQTLQSQVTSQIYKSGVCSPESLDPLFFAISSSAVMSRFPTESISDSSRAGPHLSLFLDQKYSFVEQENARLEREGKNQQDGFAIMTSHEPTVHSSFAQISSWGYVYDSYTRNQKQHNILHFYIFSL